MFDLVYDFQIDSEIKVHKNIIYRIGNDKKLKFDMFRANRMKKYNNKTVVILHGSAPMEDIKDIPIFQTWCKLLATTGFDAIVFNWRPDTDEDDVVKLLEYIKCNKEELDINTDSISVLAFSAGAEEGIGQVLASDTNNIKDIVVYYGQLNDQSIASYTKNNDINLLVAMGANDDLFSTDCNNEFIIKANNIGWKTTKLIHSSGEHGFDAFNRCLETDSIIENTLKLLVHGDI